MVFWRTGLRSRGFLVQAPVVGEGSGKPLEHCQSAIRQGTNHIHGMN